MLYVRVQYVHAVGLRLLQVWRLEKVQRKIDELFDEVTMKYEAYACTHISYWSAHAPMR